MNSNVLEKIDDSAYKSLRKSWIFTQTFLLYLGNKLWSLIGPEPITCRATNTHVPWLSDVHRCTLPWSFPRLVDFQRLVRNNRGFEGTMTNCFKLCNNVWGWQQNFMKRNNKLPRYNKTSRENGTLGFSSGAIFPLGCTKRHGAGPSQRAAIV